MNATLVAGTVLTDGDDVILVQEADSGKWNLPAGRVESGESLESAAVREATEECGITPDIDSLIGVFTKSDDNRTGIQVVYLSEIGDREPKANAEDISKSIRVPIQDVGQYDLRFKYIEESLKQYQKGVRGSRDLISHLPW